MDLGMQANRHAMGAGGLDGMLQLDAAAVNRMSLAGEGIGDVLRGYGPEELAFVTRLPREGQDYVAQGCRDPLGLRALRVVARRAHSRLRSNPLLIALGSLVRETLRE